MNICQTAQGVFEQTFRPRVPYTPFTTQVTGRDGVTHLRRASTGNMRFNATKFEVVSDAHFRIVVDGDIAPYVPYTNEPWISPKWRGAQNPNEGWFPRSVIMYATALAMALGGTFELPDNGKE